LTKNSV